MNKLFISFTIFVLSIGFAYFYVKPLYESTMMRRSDFIALTSVLNNASQIEELITKTEKTLKDVDPVNRARFAKLLPETIDPLRLANDLLHIGEMNGIVIENISFAEEHAKGMDESSSAAIGVGGVTQNVVNVFTVGRKEELKLAAEEKASVAAANTRASFTITSVTTTQDKKYSTTKANFSFDATRGKFLSFLYNLEENLGLINVLSLSFAPIPETQEEMKSKVAVPPTYRYTMTIETYSLK